MLLRGWHLYRRVHTNFFSPVLYGAYVTLRLYQVSVRKLFFFGTLLDLLVYTCTHESYVGATRTRVVLCVSTGDRSSTEQLTGARPWNGCLFAHCSWLLAVRCLVSLFSKKDDTAGMMGQVSCSRRLRTK